MNIKPKFNVNMTMQEWQDYQRELARRRAWRQFAAFFLKYIIPVLLIYFGYTEKYSNTGLGMIIVGVAWLLIPLILMLLQHKSKKRVKKFHHKHKSHKKKKSKHKRPHKRRKR